MHTVTISPKFQVVIPKKVREALGLHSGEKAKVFPFRNRIEIIPIRNVKSLRGYLKGIDTHFVRDEDRLLNLVDSSAWLAYFAEEPTADFFPMQLRIPICSLFQRGVFTRFLKSY